MAVLPALPITGVHFILGNDIAGDKVVPPPEVLDGPTLILESDNTAQKCDIFPACVVTRAQPKKYGVDISDSFMALEQDSKAVSAASETWRKAQPTDADASFSSSSTVMNLPATWEEFIAVQQGDSTLSKCHSSALSQEKMEIKMKKSTMMAC